jgi:hypothetical protein
MHRSRQVSELLDASMKPATRNPSAALRAGRLTSNQYSCYHPSMRSVHIVIFLVPSLFLSACDLRGSVTDVNDALNTASGSIHEVRRGINDAVAKGKEGIERTKEGLAEVQRKANQVRQGIENIASGSKLIEGALK